MKFSRIKIVTFFIALLLLGWFLYPRELFLGFIYEGGAELSRAERYYLSYLKSHTLNKFATLRLANLYERKGEPEKAAPWLKQLYEKRSKDWKVANRYLNYFEDLHAEEELYRLRREIAKNFIEAPLFPKGRIKELLEDALSYAIWSQKTEDVYQLIEQIARIARRPEDYYALKADYDRGLKKTQEVLAYLHQQLEAKPTDEELRQEMSTLYAMEGNIEEAFAILDAGLKLNPQSLNLLDTQMVLQARLKNWQAAIAIAQTILQLEALSSQERADYMEKLAVLYHKTGQEEKRRSLYVTAFHSQDLSDKDRIFFADQLDIFYRDRHQLAKVKTLYEEIVVDATIAIQWKAEYVDKLAFFYTQQRELDQVIALYQTTLLSKDLESEDRLHFIQNLGSLYNQRRQKALLIQLFRNEIEGELLYAEEKSILMGDLGDLYLNDQQFDPALKLYNQAFELDPEAKENWLNLIYFYERTKVFDKELTWLQNYLEKFSDDTTRQKLLVDLYLYELKSLEPLALYAGYVAERKDADVYLGVAELFLKKEKGDQAKDWAKRYYPLFSGRPKILSNLIGFFVEAKSFAPALNLCEDLLKRYPQDPLLLVQLGNLYNIKGQPKKSEEVYQRLISLKINDPEILKQVGIDILFAGQAFRAIGYLEQAIAVKKEDHESWFWLSEAFFSQGLREKGSEASGKVYALLKDRHELSEEEARIRVKTMGRLTKGSWEKDYQELMQKYPANFDLHADYLDLLIDQSQTAAAESFLAQMAEIFPKRSQELSSYEIRITFAKHDWDQAVALLETILGDRPYLWSYRRDLAESYFNAGRWRQARVEYQNVFEATGDRLGVVSPLHELEQVFDSRVETRFGLTDFGSDQFWTTRLAGQSFLSEKLQFRGETANGFFKAATDHFADHVQFGKFLLSQYQRSGLSLEGGLGFGHSPLRNSPSVHLGARWQRPANTSLDLHLDVREMRHDFPEAISGGTLTDTVRLDGDTFLGERLSLFSRYEFKRNYLPGGLSAFEHFAEPGVSYQIFRKPELQVIYYFTFSHVSDSADFLEEVPLVKNLRSHIVSLQWSHQVHPRFLYQWSLFGGEDTSKNTHLVEGDLWGTNGRLVWNLLPWLDCIGSYSFAKESLATVSGKSHQFGIAFSSHWH